MRSSLVRFQVLSWLTYWGRVTHVCVIKLTIIGPDNGLLHSRCKAIIWTNVGQISGISLAKFIHFHSRKYKWKGRLQNGYNFVYLTIYFTNILQREFAVIHTAIQRFRDSAKTLMDTHKWIVYTIQELLSWQRDKAKQNRMHICGVYSDVYPVEGMRSGRYFPKKYLLKRRYLSFTVDVSFGI